MKILVTNDDGVASPGLWVLADTLDAAGHAVTVVAPSSERSGAGAAIGHIVPGEGVVVTPVDRPGWEERAWALDGAPALCVLLALRSEHFGSGYEAVVSGINPGYNTGLSVIHSGTVGAALTAGNAGVSAVAVSLQAHTSQVGEVGLRPGIREHWATAAGLAALLVGGLSALDRPAVLNLNVPNVPVDELPEVRTATLSRFAAASLRATGSAIGPDGRLRLDLGPPPMAPVPGSDNALLAEGFATVTRLRSVQATEDPAVEELVAGLLAQRAGVGEA
jgi:5'-nucleotidase